MYNVNHRYHTHTHRKRLNFSHLSHCWHVVLGHYTQLKTLEWHHRYHPVLAALPITKAIASMVTVSPLMTGPKGKSGAVVHTQQHIIRDTCTRSFWRDACKCIKATYVSLYHCVFQISTYCAAWNNQSHEISAITFSMNRLFQQQPFLGQVVTVLCPHMSRCVDEAK